MFVNQGIFDGNKFTKYIMGILVVFGFLMVGQLPILGLLYLQNNTNQNDNYELFQLVHDTNLQLFFMLLTFAFLLYGLFWTVKNVHKQPVIKLLTSRQQFDWKRFVFAFSVWALVMILNVGYSYWQNPDHFTVNFNPVRFGILFIIGIILIPIQTAAEEVLFRGYLLQGFTHLTMRVWLSLLITSFLFGLMHFANPEVQEIGQLIYFFYIGTGLFLGLVAVLDDGLELSIGFHAANNLIVALFVTSQWSALQTDAILKELTIANTTNEMAFTLLLAYPLLLCVFSKKYKWNNYKQKLFGSKR
jgi:uncharacterized protein